MIDQSAATVTVDARLYSELKPISAALAEQPNASQVCEILSLAEGFQFQLIVCETPRVGAALLLWLDTEVARRRDEPVSLMRLSPYPLTLWDSHTELTREQLAQLMFEPLVSPVEPSGNARLIFIDASAASSQDHEAWIWLFQRFNERRNLFASHLRAPLSLCLPPSLEAEFGRAAPDLWSIRSAALTIREPAIQPAPIASILEPEMFSLAPEVTAEELEQAKQAAGSGHPSALRRLAILLSRQSDSDLQKGQLNPALRTLVEEVLPLCEQLGDAGMRAATLFNIARIHTLQGNTDEALAILREQVLPVFEELGQVHSRAVTLGQIADILVDRGEFDEALRIRREEELPVYEKLGDAHSRALTLRKISDILHSRGQFDEALRILREEVLPVVERLGEARSQALTLGKIADVLEDRGQIDEALRIRREEELPVYEKSGDIYSRALTLGKVADILRDSGQLNEALRIFREEVLPVLEKVGDIRSRAIALGKIAQILQAGGQYNEALRTLRDEVLPIFEKLGDARSLLVGRANLALIYLRRNHKGDRKKAVALLRSALNKAKELRIPEAEQIRSILNPIDQPSD
jgi:tetratricopeptide (TPR) repeat protein